MNVIGDLMGEESMVVMDLEEMADLMVWTYKRGFLDATKSISALISEVIGNSADNIIDAEVLKKVYVDMLKNRKQVKLSEATH
jgi:hypothetical protein